MDLNPSRFVGNISQSLLCPICLSVYQDPVQDPHEHIFCSKCIEEWLKQNFSCPVDRKKLFPNELKPASRVIKSLINDLEITCQYKDSGCTKIVKLESLEKHVKECDYNPNKLIMCPNGCELIIQKSTIKDHSCIKELKSELKKMQNEINRLNQEMTTKIQDVYNYINNELRNNQRATSSMSTQMPYKEQNPNPLQNFAIMQPPMQAPFKVLTSFIPTSGTDWMIKNGVQINYNTLHQCITTMPNQNQVYSFEELRYQNYSNRRK